MGLAPSRLSRAEHAAAVSGDERATLSVRGGALAPPVPQRLALTREQQPEQFGTARQALQFGLRDGADSGDLASPLWIRPRHHVGRGHNDNLMTWRERPRSPIAPPRHRHTVIATIGSRFITGYRVADAARPPGPIATGRLTVAVNAGLPRPTRASRPHTVTPILTGPPRPGDRLHAAGRSPADRRTGGRTGMEPDGDGEGVEPALFDSAGVRVLPPTFGTPDTIRDAVDEGTELGAQHPVERGVRHEHPVVAVAEVQAPPAALAQVLLVQVSWILVPLRPHLDLLPRPVRRHGGHLRQQLRIVVDSLGARRRRGPGQSVGMLRRDVTLGERRGDLGHLGQRARPPASAPSLTMRTARIAAQHLRGIHTAVVEAVQSVHRPRLGSVGARTHPAERLHQSP